MHSAADFTRGKTSLTVLASALLLAGCGGGGGGGGGPISTPPPAPAPAPAPVPSPAPTPSSATFNTTEFRRSDGPGQHGAVTAWQLGATGAGTTIAIIDTGIDFDSPEFAGRILPSSRDIAGSRSIDAVDDHGTNVALVAAAARNGSGILGQAFDASLLVLRGDTPGSCTGGDAGSTLDGCTFDDRNIATGVTAAVSAGARVINLSLGGDGGITASLANAIRQASAAGVVVVVAAGNGGDGTEAGMDPDQPTPFAQRIREAGGNNVIIVGSVDGSGTISDFSQRAGAEAAWYLGARGEGICCVYENGQIFVGKDSGGSYNLLLAGTSFATPQVAGAVALLAQAFPNLSGQQIVRLLLDTASEAGAAGVDAVYGAGVLDIAAAFAPRGTMTLAGSTTAISGASQTAIGSAATGDALRGVAGLGATALDSYGRAYGINLGGDFRAAPRQDKLRGALGGDVRTRSGGVGGASLAFTISDRTAREEGVWARGLRLTTQEARGAEVLAARVALKIAPRTELAMALREGSDGLAMQLRGADRPAFFIARDAAGNQGFAAEVENSLALRHRYGPWGITVTAQNSRADFDYLKLEAPTFSSQSLQRIGARTFGVGIDRRLGNLDLVLTGSWLQEDETVLGTLLGPSFGAGGADTLFLDAAGGFDVANGWRVGAQWRQGWTHARSAGLIASGPGILSAAWSVDFTKSGVAMAGDSLGLRISQPLRVESGALGFTLPVAYDYASLSPTYDTRFVALTPSGREVDAELAWRGMLWGGNAAASVFYRKDPGHYASVPDDRGLALSWRRDF